MFKFCFVEVSKRQSVHMKSHNWSPKVVHFERFPQTILKQCQKYLDNKYAFQ